MVTRHNDKRLALSGATDLELEQLALIHPHLVLNMPLKTYFPLVVDLRKHAQKTHRIAPAMTTGEKNLVHQIAIPSLVRHGSVPHYVCMDVWGCGSRGA